MMLLARRQGYVQLAEPQRFTAAWERDATLRLRAGDVTVLAEYEEHGRLRGGTPEEATEQAYRGWLADYLDGKDTLLIARTEDQARELSRRARDDLIRYGIVVGRPAHPPRRGRAGQRRGPGHGPPQRPPRPGRARRAGNWPTATCCRSSAPPQSPAASRPGPPAHRPRPGHRPGALVGAVPGAPPVPGRPRHPRVRDHPARRARAAPPDTAHVLVDGLGDRQGLYVAMSRGRDANYAYCITEYPAGSRRPRRAAGPPPNSHRARQLEREHAGLPAASPSQAMTPARRRPRRDPVSVLAGVLARDGSELSATETLERELSRADHLGVLGAIWDDLTRRAQAARFEHALRDACPPTSPRRPWMTRPAPGCGGPCAKPKPPGSTAATCSGRPSRRGT